MHLVRNKRTFGSLISVILILNGCANFRPNEGHRTAFSGGGKSTSAGKVSEAELQDDLLRFESQFNASIQNANRTLESSSDTNIRYRAALNRLIYSTNSLGIATGPSPNVNLLDMVAFIELSRDVLEKYWIPNVFGHGGDELALTFRQSAGDIWRIADKVLAPEQKRVLQNYINRWRQKYPNQVNVETVRLSAFSFQAGLDSKEQEEIGGLLQSVGQATEAADNARLFAERALYYAERAPTLLRLQAKLGTHEIMGEIGSSLSTMQNPLEHRQDINGLLREVQKTLSITQTAFANANTAANSLRSLFEQQASHPEAAKRSLDTLKEVTTLLQEWNQAIGPTRSLEQGGNRFLTKIAWIGAILIVFFWLMALLSKLAFAFLSDRFRRRNEVKHPDQHKDQAA